jgi:hypothetical protein
VPAWPYTVSVTAFTVHPPSAPKKVSPSGGLKDIGVLPCLAEEEEGDVRDGMVCQARSPQLPASSNSGC